VEERITPELGPAARAAVDRHLEAVADHLAAVMWECAFAIVRSAERKPAPEPRAESLDALVHRLYGEAGRIATQLEILRERTAAAAGGSESTPTGGEERAAKDEVPEEDSPRARPRRASMLDSPLRTLFKRTDDPPAAPRAPKPDGPSAAAPARFVRPAAPPVNGNARLIELARTVEQTAGHAPRLRGVS
jgi:hypothetical protein